MLERLIADDIVLGKTIEAGMTILELILRHRASVWGDAIRRRLSITVSGGVTQMIAA